MTQPVSRMFTANLGGGDKSNNVTSSHAHLPKCPQGIYKHFSFSWYPTKTSKITPPKSKNWFFFQWDFLKTQKLNCRKYQVSHMQNDGLELTVTTRPSKKLSDHHSLRYEQKSGKPWRFGLDWRFFVIISGYGDQIIFSMVSLWPWVQARHFAYKKPEFTTI